MQISRAVGIVVRHEGDVRIVDITAPATLAVGGEGEIEINLVAAEGGRWSFRLCRMSPATTGLYSSEASKLLYAGPPDIGT